MIWRGWISPSLTAYIVISLHECLQYQTRDLIWQVSYLFLYLKHYQMLDQFGLEKLYTMVIKYYLWEVKVLVARSYTILCDSMDCSPTRVLCPWNSPGKNYWSGWPFPSAGDLPNPGIQPGSPALYADYCLSHQGSPGREGEFGQMQSSCLVLLMWTCSSGEELNFSGQQKRDWELSPSQLFPQGSPWTFF